MVGLGEERDEVSATLHDLRRAGVTIVTIGQYLQPTRELLPVARYVPPQEFEAWTREGRHMGFETVFAGPLVRSSYHAGEVAGRSAATTADSMTDIGAGAPREQR